MSNLAHNTPPLELLALTNASSSGVAQSDMDGPSTSTAEYAPLGVNVSTSCRRFSHYNARLTGINNLNYLLKLALWRKSLELRAFSVFIPNVTFVAGTGYSLEGWKGGAKTRHSNPRRMKMANDQNANRGFASMDDDKQREIASKGGQSVPAEERSFSKDHDLAAEAGRKGGESVPAEERSFSKDHELAAEAGRKGGQASGGGTGSSGGKGENQGNGGNFAQNPERAAEAGRKGGQS